MYAYSLFRYMLIVGLVLAIGFPTAALAQIFFDTAAESKLWLEGSSTVHQFDCVARSIEGTAYFEEDRDVAGVRPAVGADKESVVAGRTQYSEGRISAVDRVGVSNISPEAGLSDSNRSGESNLHVLLKIPIKSFDCGRSRMNRDMYNALKSDTYEFITFEFENAEPVAKDRPDSDSLFAEGFVPFLIEGTLNVAGVDRMVSLIVRGRPEEQGRYRINGQKSISMKDYEIEPPTALRGLIRAHDNLTVFFELIVVQK